MSEWVNLGSLDSIPLRGARVVASDDGDIAVFRTSKDEVFAITDSCPHQGGALSQGIVYGSKVACPLHNWSIDLATGEAVAPDEGCTGRYDVKIEDGDVFLKI